MVLDDPDDEVQLTPALASDDVHSHPTVVHVLPGIGHDPQSDWVVSVEKAQVGLLAGWQLFEARFAQGNEANCVP